MPFEFSSKIEVNRAAVTTEWMPDINLCENHRPGWQRKTRLVKRTREFGSDLGKKMINANPCVGFPLSGDLKLSVQLWVPPDQGTLNLVSGLKPLWDGMQDAGVFFDDGQFVRVSIERHEYEAKTLIGISWT